MEQNDSPVIWGYLSPRIIDAKALTGMARALSAAMRADGIALAHSEALLALSVVLGFRSPNALSALLRKGILVLASGPDVEKYPPVGMVNLVRALRKSGHVPVQDVAAMLHEAIGALGDTGMDGMPTGFRSVQALGYMSVAVTPGLAVNRLLSCLASMRHERMPTVRDATTAALGWWTDAWHALDVITPSISEDEQKAVVDERDVKAAAQLPLVVLVQEVAKGNKVRLSMLANLWTLRFDDFDDDTETMPSATVVRPPVIPIMPIRERVTMAIKLGMMLSNGLSIEASLSLVAKHALEWPDGKGARVAEAASRASAALARGDTVEQACRSVFGSVPSLLLQWCSYSEEGEDTYQLGRVLSIMSGWDCRDGDDVALRNGQALALWLVSWMLQSNTRIDVTGPDSEVDMMLQAISRSMDEEGRTMPAFGYVRTAFNDVVASVNRKAGNPFSTFPPMRAANLRFILEMKNIARNLSNEAQAHAKGII